MFLQTLRSTVDGGGQHVRLKTPLVLRPDRDGKSLSIFETVKMDSASFSHSLCSEEDYLSLGPTSEGLREMVGWLSFFWLIDISQVD